MNDKAVQAVGDLLEALGIDWKKAGMEKTPERVARMYELLFDGVGQDTRDIWGETFDAGPGSEGIVAVRHIPFYSMCEHHLLPFFGEVDIAYLPAPCGVAGFSKFAKLVEVISHRPQLQERMTGEIAEAIAKDLGAKGVLVSVEAQQLCMTMRGELAHGTRTVTSFCTGRLREETALKEQAWNLLGKEHK